MPAAEEKGEREKALAEIQGALEFGVSIVWAPGTDHSLRHPASPRDARAPVSPAASIPPASRLLNGAGPSEEHPIFFLTPSEES